jgi:sulfite oxidase
VGAGFLAFVLAGFCTNPISFDAAVAEYPSAVESIVEEDDIGNISYYHLADIRKHGPDSERPWVTYKGRVYDITDWVSAHPGGEVILRAAGGSIEPYWDIFSIHKSQYVLDILDQFAIGWVHPDDLGNGGVGLIEDPFQTDPERDARMQILTERPFNAETPTSELADSFLTPNDVFYVRNHMWVPVVGRAIDYDITIELPNGETKKYTIRDLQTRFKQHSVTAVLQCSGNRRKDMTDHAKKTNGLQWTVGAISCAKWEGVRLRDVLADAGVPLEHRDSDMQHVQFTGLEAYGASIPIASALDPLGDVLLAFRMNDEPLPRDHGFPVRVIVPGHVAARCVKWLKRIIVSDEESNTPWQRKDYKCFGPNETAQDWDKYKSIQKMPVTSAITRTRVRQGSPKGQTQPSAENPSASSSYQEETWPEANIIEIEGYAYSGGGREVQRVDISLDGGKTWDQARLLNEDAQLERGSQPWCWKRWKYESVLQIKNDNEASQSQEQKMTVVVKATDDTYNTQPETHGSIYNPRGNLATAWHRVEMSLSGERKELTGAAERNVKNDS